jgi:hypothetical protein
VEEGNKVTGFKDTQACPLILLVKGKFDPNLVLTLGLPFGEILN